MSLAFSARITTPNRINTRWLADRSMMARDGHSAFELAVARILKEAGVRFLANPAIGGVQPDFVVQAADGRRYVLEVKGWDPGRRSLDRAVEQARLYQRATGADDAFLVLPKLAEGDPKRGLLALHEVAHWAAGDWSVSSKVATRSGRMRGARKRGPRKRAPGRTTRWVFAAMPFAAEYDDVFFSPMAHAAESIGATCKRVDREDFEGDIVEEIKRLIDGSVAVIADLSEARPNVLYEIGYSHALKKPTVPIYSGPPDGVPFDVRNWNVLQYKRGQTHHLRDTLARRLRAAVSKR